MIKNVLDLVVSDEFQILQAERCVVTEESTRMNEDIQMTIDFAMTKKANGVGLSPSGQQIVLLSVLEFLLRLIEEHEGAMPRGTEEMMKRIYSELRELTAEETEFIKRCYIGTNLKFFLDYVERVLIG